MNHLQLSRKPLLVLLFTLLATPHASADVILSLESVSAAPGSTGNQFDVLLTNTGPSSLNVPGSASASRPPTWRSFSPGGPPRPPRPISLPAIRYLGPPSRAFRTLRRLRPPIFSTFRSPGRLSRQTPLWDWDELPSPPPMEPPPGSSRSPLERFRGRASPIRTHSTSRSMA